MNVTQDEKAVRFRELHDGPEGSARILAGLGFEALATTSAASAAALGRKR
jgi:2-methylisocitrate lyase-like PEP mutase family enzyme